MKPYPKKVEMIVERTNTGYSAYAQDLPIATTGATFQELKANMLLALSLYIEETSKDKYFPHDDMIRVTLDLPQFFEFYKVINAKALSERIGMNQSLLAQYISGQKKPSAKQVERILDGIRAIGRELSEIELVH
ncbi:type II toxin-antitoxin system HicB family antitoxin [Hymenobacter cavernae]|uniref:HTH cro/C1-type domain-containing protein n=1 Tax=Hymenobacter cavernae TaxID=2044852 RepID=A0ABQ1UN66_9BACT|nr:helix-turn-helix transcriptional regulator [Hymenobacter cavernae]GGF22407.1 hypothetical protein GCM10011383_37550 [Hymenobacter cavernae]